MFNNGFFIGMGLINLTPEVLATSLRGVQMVLNSTCNQAYMRYYNVQIVDSAQVCYQDSQRISRTCEGDSGGAIYALMGDGDEPCLIGFEIFSHISCESGLPSVFIRAGHFLQWIMDVYGSIPKFFK